MSIKMSVHILCNHTSTSTEERTTEKEWKNKNPK